jgi:hypothetical protein
MNHVELLFGPEYREHHFFHVPGQAFVVCVVVLQNGFIITGQAGRVYAGNSSLHTLEREAAQDAFNKTGALAAFRECERLRGEPAC